MITSLYEQHGPYYDDRRLKDLTPPGEYG